ncbi:MAG: uroporphyrinogen-III C-methyltransferase [Candidatus Omnitrophica bacterium]|nr:uroporphyrinogen-III C-methyltransferase [Candidatus Omnitrophota bacterium]
MEERKNGKVYLVGAGPGDAGLLTMRGAVLLAKADIVVYDRLVNPEILAFASRAEKIYVGKSSRGEEESEKMSNLRQMELSRLLVHFAKEGKTVIRLKGGDPFVFGRGGEEAGYLKQHGIDFEIVPGVSAGYAVPAYAGIPVTDRRLASSVIFATAHEDPTKKTSSVDWKKMASFEGTLVAFMGVKKLASVVKSLMQGGKPPTAQASVIEWGTLPKQRVVEADLAHIVQKVKAQKIKSPAVMVLGEVNRYRKKIAWFHRSKNFIHAKPLFGKTVLITRARAQASGLRQVLETEGARVVEFPTIRIEPPKSWEALDQAVKNIQGFDWIIFTSIHGVASFFNRLEERKKDARDLSHLKIAAIGEATARALRAKSIYPDLIPQKFTSEVLVEELRRQNEISGRRFLLPRTDIAPEFLKRELQKWGGFVTEAIAYRTLPAQGKSEKLERIMKNHKIDYITFTSSSTVKNFFEAMDRAKRKVLIKSRLISIGPVTTKTLMDFGLKPFREAQEQTLTGLVEAMTCEKNP